MKKLFKFGSGLFIACTLSLLMVVNADAQRGAMRGGSGAVRIGGGFGGGFRGGIGFGGFRGGISFGYPRLGFFIGALPYGYYPFYWGPNQYFYADGAFYMAYNGGYQVVTPPVGAAVPALPRGAKSIMIDNQQYYVYNGVYYKIIINDQGKKVYIVAGKDGVLNTDGSQAQQDQQPAGPRVGDISGQLPDNCRKVNLNGKKYFVSPDDVYYEEIKDNNGNTAYRIASVPDDQQHN